MKPSTSCVSIAVFLLPAILHAAPAITGACVVQATPSSRTSPMFDTGYSPNPAVPYLHMWQYFNGMTPFANPSRTSCGYMTGFGVGMPMPGLSNYRRFEVFYDVGNLANECNGFYPTTTIEVWSNKFATTSHPELWKRVASRSYSGCPDGSFIFELPMICDDDHCDVPDVGDQYNIVVRTLNAYGSSMTPTSRVNMTVYPI